MTRGCGQCCWQTKILERVFRGIYSIQQHIFFYTTFVLRSKESSWAKKKVRCPRWNPGIVRNLSAGHATKKDGVCVWQSCVWKMACVKVVCVCESCYHMQAQTHIHTYFNPWSESRAGGHGSIHQSVANEATDVWRGYAVWSTARTCESNCWFLFPLWRCLL